MAGAVGIGTDGVVDLMTDIDQVIAPDLETGEIGYQGAPVVARNIVMPAAFSRSGVTPDDLIDFTPALKAEGIALASRFKLGPSFTPPVVSRWDGPLGTRSEGPINGGSDWPGGAYDPESHRLYIYASNNSPSLLALVKPDSGTSDMNVVRGIAPPPPGAEPSGGLTVRGLPLLSPPYDSLTTITIATTRP